MNPTKQYIGAGLIALGLFLVWMLAVPAYNKISAYQSAIHDRQATLDERSKIFQHIQDLNGQLRANVGDTRRFAAVIPTKKELAELISAIDRIALNAGIQVSEINVSENRQGKETYNSMSLSLKIVGQYANLLSFFDGIEKNIRLLDVLTTEISRDVGSPTLSVKVIANAYFLK